MKFVVLFVTAALLVLFGLAARHFIKKNVRTYKPDDTGHAEREEPVDVETHGDPEPKEKADMDLYEKKPRRQPKKKQ